MFGRERLGAGDWAVMALGVLFGLIGVVLTIGGGWLIAVGGSWYYLLAGLGLIAGVVLDRLLNFDDAFDAGGEWDEGGGVHTRWQ